MNLKKIKNGNIYIYYICYIFSIENVRKYKGSESMLKETKANEIQMFRNSYKAKTELIIFAQQTAYFRFK